jgi:phosphomannomutase
LNHLRDQYGDFVSYNYYVINNDTAVTDILFHELRTTGDAASYKRSFAGVDVVTIKDVTCGYDSSTADNSLDMPATPGSHMIMYEFANGVSFTLRTSGTEPKIKWYTEVAAKAGTKRQVASEELKTFVDAAIQEMLQCAKYGIK